MSVSAAQFARWLRGQNGARPTVLVEIAFAYETASGPVEGTIYLSDQPYAASPTDSPPNVHYRDVVNTAPIFERAIDVATLGGRGRTAVGALVLDNSDGGVDFLLDAIIDGREVRVYMGDQTWPRADFRLLNAAVVAAVKANDTELSIELRDKNFLLDKTIIGSPIATGPNAGKPRPIALGVVKNFDATPYLLDTAALKYYINDFALSPPFLGILEDVRDSGASLAGYTINAAAATIQLTSPPAGRVTIDMTLIDAAGEIASASPHTMFKYILKHYSGLSPSQYDTVAIDDLIDVEAPTLLQFGRVITDRMNVLDLLDEIAQCTYSWYGWNASGVLTVGRLDLPNLDAATSVDTINITDIDAGGLSCENLALPWGKVTLDTKRNVVVQTDGLAGSVSANDRSLWGQPYQLRVSTTDPGGTTYVANWWDYHKSATDSKPIELSVDNAGFPVSHIQDQCDAITQQFKPWTRVYRCTTFLDKYFRADGTLMNPGDCVTLTYPRFGLAAGKKVRIMSVRPRLSDGLLDLVMVRQVTPDYTSTSH